LNLNIHFRQFCEHKVGGARLLCLEHTIRSPTLYWFWAYRHNCYLNIIQRIYQIHYFLFLLFEYKSMVKNRYEKNHQQDPFSISLTFSLS